jgi:hypothetical protein
LRGGQVVQGAEVNDAAGTRASWILTLGSESRR